MRVIQGRTTVADVDEFLAFLDSVADEHDCVVQAFDARYVVDEAHLRTAVDRAARAWRRDDAIARDPGVEMLLYAAGRRQISRALELGVSEGEAVPVVAVVVGAFPGDPFETDDREAAAADALAAEWTDDAVLGTATDEARICEFFGITDAERTATAASLSELVRERVSLLVVEK
ncbi:KEOPS complex subunit Cgi121 [Haloarchaeobius litoreus]|uniref:KEOPS complex subunit Cgi121 n=1 Tax=Haloarchaeobius litoreus TaxID=755306 RepID=A0ABD6DN91_9EURY|nr:KEOPS complex subunit Cgi121 [Haloarchaeobius litoreus]